MHDDKLSRQTLRFAQNVVGSSTVEKGSSIRYLVVLCSFLFYHIDDQMYHIQRNTLLIVLLKMNSL